MIKRGQLKISFGMIFSIILIIVFVAFAFFVVTKFIGIGTEAQIGKFKNDLQTDINKVWKASQGSQEEEYFIPEKITYVCIMDYNSDPRGDYINFYEDLRWSYFTSENLFFYPVEVVDSSAFEIKNIDLYTTTDNDNPFCIKNQEGKIKFTLKKDFGENLVLITE